MRRKHILESSSRHREQAALNLHGDSYLQFPWPDNVTPGETFFLMLAPLPRPVECSWRVFCCSVPAAQAALATGAYCGEPVEQARCGHWLFACTNERHRGTAQRARLALVPPRSSTCVLLHLPLCPLPLLASPPRPAGTPLKPTPQRRCPPVLLPGEANRPALRPFGFVWGCSRGALWPPCGAVPLAQTRRTC